MARTKLNPEYEIEVGGEPYLWRVHRQPQWSIDPVECHGKAIAVRHKEGQREAVVEFPLGSEPRYGAPLVKANQFAKAVVTRAIESAIASGWEPLSRGKTVAVMVDDTGA